MTKVTLGETTTTERTEFAVERWTGERWVEPFNPLSSYTDADTLQETLRQMDRAECVPSRYCVYRIVRRDITTRQEVIA